MKKAAEACLNFNSSGLSLLEISHRSKDYVAVMDEARSIIKELLEIGDNYEVLYLGGGASLQFGMVPYNLLSESGYAAYLNTGVWASKAIQEAQKVGMVKVLASSEDKNFTYIPKNYNIPNDADYFHITSNNTIYGTQIKEFASSNIPLVCDMSSDIFSRKIDANKFAMIYAGAQKNMGPAGATLVVIRKDMVGKAERKKLSMLDYAVHIKGESMYNTPPVFPVYVVLETLKWLKNNGGVSWIEKLNNEKAELLYNEIDANPLFYGTVAKEDRSYMNVCFLLHKPELETEFEKASKEAGISGIKGHRSVGGYRASIYNAMPIESVKILTEVMKEFAIKHG
jgi:phosphoserine aminotransferase